MEKRNPVNWFQVLALCSALGLGGAYVWSRQKQAAPPTRLAETPVVSSEASNQAPKTDLKPVDNTKETQRIILSGSKSGIIAVPPDEVETKPDENPNEPRILMPSSKSGAIVPPTEIPVAPKQRTIMPSSKSISPLLDHPKENKP